MLAWFVNLKIVIMKNELKKSRVLVILIILFATYNFVGCQQESDIKNSLPFLTIDTDIEFSKLSKNEQAILMEAYGRLNISNEDGLFNLKQISGEQVNISENIFLYFKSIIDETNQSIISSEINLSRPRTRTATEIDTNMPTDCVAHAISWALRDGDGKPVSEVTQWVESQYGNNGVPGDQFYTVLNHYFYGSPIPIPTKYEFYNSNKVIMAIRIPGGGHAVTLLSIEGPNVIYQDNQDGNKVKMCLVLDIIYLYSIYGAR